MRKYPNFAIVILCITIILFFAAADQAVAGTIIPDRLTLDILLGAERLDEDFENISISDWQILSTGSSSVKHLDSTTYFQGQGPGLVVDGIRIQSTNPDTSGTNAWIQWNGNGYFGANTKTIYSDRDLLIDFLSPTIAFGIDIKDYKDGWYRSTYIAGVTVFGADDSTILYSSSSIDIPGPQSTEGVFFGYEEGTGIGSVVFSTIDGDTWVSPQVDNLSFSTANIASPVPEPATMLLLGSGLLGFAGARRKSKRN